MADTLTLAQFWNDPERLTAEERAAAIQVAGQFASNERMSGKKALEDFPAILVEVLESIARLGGVEIAK